MIITLSGAPGNGKNQIISSLKEHGYNVVSKQGADGTLEGQFVLVENYKNQMKKCLDRGGVCIFESSFIDMIVYAYLWIGVFDDTVDEIIKLREDCVNYQKTLVDQNFNLYYDTTQTTYHNENWNAIANLYYDTRIKPPYCLDGLKSVELNTKIIIDSIEEYASE